MLGHPSPVRAAADEHYQRGHARGRPPEVTGDPRRESTATVHRGQQVRDVHQGGLEFDNEDHPSHGMPGQQIDHASLTE
jgi:hypothetical protein